MPSFLTAGLLTVQLLRQTLAEADSKAGAELLSAARHMAAAGQYALISGNTDQLQQILEQERAGEGLKFTCIRDDKSSLRFCAGIPDHKALSLLPSPGQVLKGPNSWLAAHPIILPDVDMGGEVLVAAQPAQHAIGYAIDALVALRPVHPA